MIDYSRQAIFDTQKLGSAKITVVGGGLITNYLALYITALGIRELKIIDNKNGEEGEFLTGDRKRNRAEQLEEKLKKINSEMNIKPRTNLDDLTLGKPDVLVELTNEKSAQEKCTRYATANRIPLISGATDEDNGSLYVQDNCRPINKGVEKYHGKKQGKFTSGMIAAVALDEIRKIVMPMEDDNRLRSKMEFSLHNPKRFGTNIFNGGIERIPALKALVVGAGGIGTYVGLNLALMGVDMDIIDGDKIENHNLNRQVFYYGRVGENKAVVLSERLGEFSKSRINALPYYLKDESQIKRNYYNIIFSCLDNWEWRFRLSNYALRNKIRFINGAVSTFSARAEFSECLECKYDKKSLIEGQKNQRANCGNMNSNVVMPNAFVGALMASEAKAIAMPNRYRSLEGTEIRYNSKNDDIKKFVMLNGRARCSCRK